MRDINNLSLSDLKILQEYYESKFKDTIGNLTDKQKNYMLMSIECKNKINKVVEGFLIKEIV